MLARIVVVLSLLTPAAVLAGETEKAASVKNLAMLIVVESRCPTLRPNYLVMIRGMSALGVEPKDWADGGRYRDVMTAELARVKSQSEGMSQDMFCGLMEDGFGPRGAIASGMLSRR